MSRNCWWQFPEEATVRFQADITVYRWFSADYWYRGRTYDGGDGGDAWKIKWFVGFCTWVWVCKLLCLLRPCWVLAGFILGKLDGLEFQPVWTCSGAGGVGANSISVLDGNLTSSKVLCCWQLIRFWSYVLLPSGTEDLFNTLSFLLKEEGRGSREEGIQQKGGFSPTLPTSLPIPLGHSHFFFFSRGAAIVQLRSGCSRWVSSSLRIICRHQIFWHLSAVLNNKTFWSQPRSLDRTATGYTKALSQARLKSSLDFSDAVKISIKLWVLFRCATIVISWKLYKFRQRKT